jgi:hypothetical protein
LARSGLSKEFLIHVTTDHTSPASYQFGGQVADPTPQIDDGLSVELGKPLEDGGPVTPTELPFVLAGKAH